MTIARFAPVGEVSVDAELTGAEQARHDRLRFAADRDAYRAAHLLVRACAGELLGVVPERVRLQQHCPRCGSTDHGRPSIVGQPEVWVSLSHTRGHVAAVAATSECGIDVERIAGSIPRTAVTPREQAWLDTAADPLLEFTRLWVRKEALVKVGVADEPGRIDVLGPDIAPAPATRIGGFALTDWAGPTDALGRPAVWGCVVVRADSLQPIGGGRE
ncbi:4'-phosphopantetheinyl transferase family protein [Micropruina sp.]|uniref:4'-phosphopantetheinyl transferase family protein n=1 Tax=Micropruina sp. TaxID=2737536 RepID=UPI0039E6FF6D